MEKFSLSFHKFTLKGAWWCWVPRNLKQDAVTFFSSILLCTLIFCIFWIPFRISVHYVTSLKNFFFFDSKYKCENAVVSVYEEIDYPTPNMIIILFRSNQIHCYPRHTWICAIWSDNATGLWVATPVHWSNTKTGYSV